MHFHPYIPTTTIMSYSHYLQCLFPYKTDICILSKYESEDPALKKFLKTLFNLKNNAFSIWFHCIILASYSFKSIMFSIFAFMPEISISFKPLLHLSMEFSDSGSLCLSKCYHILTRMLDKMLSSLNNKVSVKYDF